MSGLSRSGFNEWQTKYVLGKSIPMSDRVYLQTLEQEVRERYPAAFENYLNLSNMISKDLKKKTKEIEKENKRLKDKFVEMEKENKETKDEIRNLSRTVDALLKKLENLTEG